MLPQLQDLVAVDIVVGNGFSIPGLPLTEGSIDGFSSFSVSEVEFADSCIITQYYYPHR
jgi:hypothetical protein